MFCLFSFEAFAACNVHGQIVRVQNTDNNINPNNFIYLRGSTSSTNANAGLTNYVYIGATTDDSIAIAAGSSLTAGTRTFLTGDAATCPSTGDQRSIGNIRAIIINP